MRNPALQERRNRQILADIVRTYIETGEPVSSRAISQRFEEILSPATIRNVMADLEDGGLLYQPHTSAGACRRRRRTGFLRRKLHRRRRLPWTTATGSSGSLRARRRHRKLPSGRGTCWRKFPTGWELSFRSHSEKRFWNIRACGCCRTDAWWWCWFRRAGIRGTRFCGRTGCFRSRNSTPRRIF